MKVKGVYTDAAATPTAKLLGEIEFVDASLGLMVRALKAQGLLDTTLIIITAKHGQSPIDPNRFQEEGSGITTSPADVLVTAPNNFLPAPPAGGAPENPNTPSEILGPGPPRRLLRIESRTRSGRRRMTCHCCGWRRGPA